jgi:hypothetical protein
MKVIKICHFIQCLFIFISIYLLPSFRSSSGHTEEEVEEVITHEGPCEMDTAPHQENECFERTNHTHSCCYGEKINESENLHEESHSAETFCFGVDSYFKFAPHFIQEIQIDHTIKKVHLTCRNENKRTCSRANPKILEDCRIHGGDENSCCMITMLNKETNCILSKELIDVDRNYTIFGNLVQCSSKALNNTIYIILSIFIIIFI